jgi:hypothetical protein
MAGKPKTRDARRSRMHPVIRQPYTVDGCRTDEEILTHLYGTVFPTGDTIQELSRDGHIRPSIR